MTAPGIHAVDEQHREALRLRLEAFLDRNGPVVRVELGPCWIFTGSRNRKKYGVFTFPGRKQVTAHRAAWMIFVGPIPQGALLLHKCDNPPCCNPAHLVPGTYSDNSLDMARKGRSLRGEDNPRSKLTWSIVRQMRERFTEGLSVGQASRDYGLAYRTAQLIRDGVLWSEQLASGGRNARFREQGK